MRFTFLASLLFLMLTTSAFAVRVYQSPTMGDAVLRLAITPDIGKADAAIHRVGSWGAARGPYLVFITKNKSDAETTWFFTSIGMAQCVIVFVDTAAQAGALTPNAKRCFR